MTARREKVVGTEAERAVVGAMLIDGKVYWKICNVVNADDFSEPKLRTLYAALADFAKREIEADFITLGEAVPALAEFAMDLQHETPSSRNAKRYAERMAREAQVRKVHAAGKSIVELDPREHQGGVFAAAQRILSACMRSGVGTVRTLGALYRDVYASVRERYYAETSEMSGLSTGFVDLDEMTDGLQPAELVVIGARPSIGKTALGVQICIHNGRNKKTSLFVSAEMAAKQLAMRAIQNIAELDSLKMRRPKRMSEAEWFRFTEAQKEIDTLPMFVVDDALSLEAICAKAHELHATEGLALVVIDYLQLLEMPQADKMADAVQIITRGLKRLAVQLNIPVVILSQLNREGDAEPLTKHLRDSGGIEQDGDLIILMWRPDKKRPDIVDAKVAKQRNGPTGHVYLTSNMATNRFGDQPADYAGPKPPTPRPGTGGMGAEDGYGGHRE